MSSTSQTLLSLSPITIPSGRALAAIQLFNAVAADPTTGPSVDDVKSFERQGVKYWQPGDPNPDKYDLVNILIKNNYDAWKKILDNQFCKSMASTGIPEFGIPEHGMPEGLPTYDKVLEGFKYYTVQDYKYCVQLLRYDAERMSKTKEEKRLLEMADRISGDLSYVQIVKQTCTDTLGIKEDVVNAVNPEAASTKYSELEFEAAETQDWIISLVALIPCFQVYYKIATDILSTKPFPDPRTPWYNHWILPNSDAEVKEACIDQINFFKAAQIDWENDKRLPDLGKIFTDACNHEVEFFGFGENPRQNL
ncbi:hypothetical protein CERSUDRAFT_116124 [Gelatoporia subvermispora B]|uniref:Thiaminase-2/PQQC domain-containing protein n=1 Tax=Ceriporiopsis subvermispora (strain B) TaxID=914234 RepID=M2PH05_CERS8|nr:hypothetical protein CERSUDRAFT_116124 [Gelatoporia subvermispora B]